MTTSIMRAISGFTKPLTATCYPRISSRCFMQVSSSLHFGMCRFQVAKEATFCNRNSNVDLSYTIYQKSVSVLQSRLEIFVRYSSSTVRENGLSAAQLLLILLLITATGITLTNESQADSPHDPQLERIIFLLEKRDGDRTIEERIELFNALSSKGMEEADKAVGEDVVIVFGDTGAGKSTLINFIYGCRMTKDEEGNIVVDPAFYKKEVAQIGIEPHSCTFIPKKIPTICDEEKKNCITCFDMPGLSDDRGIEVALANTVILQHIIERAHSVRFVMVFEAPLITAERGSAWKRSVKLLSERFNDRVGREEKSLRLVITKGGEDIASIRSKIERYTPKGSLNLSGYVVVYDPLNNTFEHRKDLFNKLYETKSYEGLDINIAMGGDQLWDALMLGDQIKEEIRKDLAKPNGAGIGKAVSKIQFTHKVKNLKNKDLAKAHESAEKAAQEYAKKIVDAIESAKTAQDKIEENKKYQSFKSHFGPLVNFEASDKSVASIKNNTEDPRVIAWDQDGGAALVVASATTTAAVATTIGSASIATASAAVSAAAAATTAAAAGTAAATAAVAVLPIAIPAAVAIYAFKRWYWPSQEEKELSEFCKK